MALGASLRNVLLIVCLVSGTSAVLGPDEGLGGTSPRRRETPTPCPSNCYCSSEVLRCEQWPKFGDRIENTFQFPRNVQEVSFLHWPAEDVQASIFYGMQNLQLLRISVGSLVNFPSLPVLHYLSYLDLSNNKLVSLPPKALENASYIVHLNVSGNNIKNVSEEFLSGLGNLRELDISRNTFILQLPLNFFFTSNNLRFLDLSATNVGHFEKQWSDNLQNLHFLNISHNDINSLPYISLTTLEVLDSSYNPLTSLPKLDGFPYLKELYVSHTQISYLTKSETEGCNRLQLIDISYSNITNLDEGVLSHCAHFREINLSNNLNLWRIEHGALSGLKNLLILRLNDCPNLYDLEDDVFNGLVGLRELYLQESGVKVLPYTLGQLQNLTILNLEGITLLCDCYAHWLPQFLNNADHSSFKGINSIKCYDGTERTLSDLRQHMEKLNCSPVEVLSMENEWVLTPWGQSALMECNVTGNPAPKIIWQTVDHHLHVYNKSMQDHPWIHHQISQALSVAQANTDGKYQVLQSGQLLIRDVRREDIGRYKCFAFNAVSNSSIVTFLGLQDTAYRAFILESILFGFACAALFLFITLLVQFINYIMERLGIECCCCQNRHSPKAKQIRQMIESVESYKSAQLERLRENYTYQVASIKDSCYQQMERVRESYANQSKNLKDLCDYSTQQWTGARDQYLDQVNKIRDYSMSQMNRVRENYVFQRHRIRKFSGHQLLRLRETYKYQQKTLNKLMETLPDLYIQNCRTGSCQRTDSILFENEIDGLDVYYKVDFLDAQSYTSDYYTPASTLTRQSRGGGKLSHSRDGSCTSGGTDYQEARSNITRQESIGSEKENPHQRFHSRSFSLAMPPTGVHSSDGVRCHKRSISASSHPSPHLFFPKPPLMEESGDLSPLVTPTSQTPISSKGTPLYTPLALTPVHDQKLSFKDVGKYLRNHDGMSKSDSALTPTSHDKDFTIYIETEKPTDQKNCDIDLMKVDESICDKESSDEKSNKMSYETSI